MSKRCSFCGERPPPGAGLVTGPEVTICHTCAAIAAEVLSDPIPPPDRILLTECRLAVPSPRLPRLEVIDDGAVAIRGGVVSWVGPLADLPDHYRRWDAGPCDGRLVLPGLVDAGAWVLGSVHRRPPDPDRLVGAARTALAGIVRTGVTTIDVRAGGSPDPLIETILLAGARAAGETATCGVVVSWVVSPRLEDDDLTVLGPTAARLAGLALVVNRGGGDPRPRAEAVRPMRPRLLFDHPEPPEGDWLSVEFGSKIFPIPDQVVVLRPDCLIAGGPVDLGDGCLPALASGYDPDGVEAPGLGLAMLLAVELGNLSIEQAVWAATRGSALALGEEIRGLLRPGVPADLLILDGDRVEDLVRRPHADPWRVMVGGAPIVE